MDTNAVLYQDLEKILVTREEIAKAVQELGRKLTEKYSFLKENDVLTEEYVRTLTPEQQEICNQLNRRTEFRVTSTTYGMFDKQGHLIVSPAHN